MKIWIYTTINKEVGIVVKDRMRPYFLTYPHRLQVCHFWKRRNKKIKIRSCWFNANKSYVYTFHKFPNEAKKVIYFIKADYLYLHEILDILKKGEYETMDKEK